MALLVSACQAQPPSLFDAGAGVVRRGRYATLGRCVAPSRPGVCPGESCGNNVVGPPDGSSVDMARCGTLDAVFTGGTVLSVVGRADLAIHLGTNQGGSVNIEVSHDGFTYHTVGYINSAPAGTSSRCLAQLDGKRVLVDMASCYVISNVSFIRLSNLSASVGISVDAIEALSFKAR